MDIHIIMIRIPRIPNNENNIYGIIDQRLMNIMAHHACWIINGERMIKKIAAVVVKIMQMNIKSSAPVLLLRRKCIFNARSLGFKFWIGGAHKPPPSNCSSW